MGSPKRRAIPQPQSAQSPIAIVETVGNRQTVVRVSGELRKAGARAGMTLAQVRAICPELMHLPYEPARDLRALEALGRWMMRFSPVVALDPPEGLLLEVGGSERVFGGLDVLLSRVDQALRKLGLPARLAIAPTVGAAWALARCNKEPAIISPDGLADALAPLPTGALRIDADVSEMLHHLGIETIGQLIDLPREALPARFGSELLMRIDQALGWLAEPLVPLAYQTPIEAATEFDGTIDSLEAIEWVLGQLLKDVLKQLASRGVGARRIDARFISPYAPPIEKQIPLSRPSRDPVNLFNLLRCALETVKTGEGFSAIRLAVPLFDRLADEQIHLIGSEQQAAQKELSQLIERLRVRLGEGTVLQPRLVESHLPEKAFELKEADQGADEEERSAFSASKQSAAAKRKLKKKTECPPEVSYAKNPRPLHLLQTPIEVRVMVSPSDDREGRPISFMHEGVVHPVAHAVGPERIAGRWWAGHNKTRDYFDTQDSQGRRFWIFRVVQTGRWYVQGGWK